MIECPYCKKEDDDPEDFVEPSSSYTAECTHCKKEYSFEVEYTTNYYTSKIPCNDGEPHKWRFLYDYHQKYAYQCRYCEKKEWRDEKEK